jgi:hypothetical protein
MTNSKCEASKIDKLSPVPHGGTTHEHALAGKVVTLTQEKSTLTQKVVSLLTME